MMNWLLTRGDTGRIPVLATMNRVQLSLLAGIYSTKAMTGLFSPNLVAMRGVVLAALALTVLASATVR